MVLEIIPLENGYKIKGELSKKTLPKFRRIIQKAFLSTEHVTLDIDSLTSIDRNGVNALALLHNRALLKGKTFQIVGLENLKILEQIKGIDAA